MIKEIIIKTAAVIPPLKLNKNFVITEPEAIEGYEVLGFGPCANTNGEVTFSRDAFLRRPKKAVGLNVVLNDKNGGVHLGAIKRVEINH